MRATYPKLIIIAVMFAVSLLLMLAYLAFNPDFNILSYSLILILSLTLISYFILCRRIFLFDPITIFSAYYFLVVPAAYYSLVTNFEKGEYATSFQYDQIYIFNLAVTYLIVGYISSVIGYVLFKKKGDITIRFDTYSELPDRILLPFIVVNFMAGVINFIVNIYKIAGGNIIQYMSTLSVRHYIDQEISHTTLYYLNTYLSIFLLIFYIERSGKRKSLLIMPLITAFIMLFSTGRGFTTISFFLSIICIYYIVNYDGRNSNYNIKYIKPIIYIFPVALLLYIIRIGSSIMLNEKSARAALDSFSQVQFSELLLFMLFDKGNLPNIPVLMKIIDSWGNDIGFLYGKSLVTWITNILPSALRPLDYQPSVMIKNAEWFPYALGAHPPTGVGEMYANFGLLGAFWGMFLFGAFCAFLYNMLLKYNNYWMLVIYSQIAIGFILIYPKGEFDNLSLWQIAPVLVAYMILRFTTCILQSSQSIRFKET